MDANLNTPEREKAREWFRNSLFNLVIDYYTEVPGRPYGTGLTEDGFAEYLKKINPGFVIVYAKGHSGRTVFPSALPTMHPMAREGLLPLYRSACDRAGVKLFLYYSGLTDGIAALNNPDWRMHGRDFLPVKTGFDYMMYPICPLGGYFDEWVAVHLKEIFELADPDGIWVDGDWQGPCTCGRCANRFREQTGYDGPLPPEGEPTSETAIKWQECWNQISREWRDKFNAHIKKLKPSCMYSAGNVAARWEYSYQCDWKSGDWFSPNYHRVRQSIAMRRYASQGVPYDAMTCDTSFVHGKEWIRSRAKPLLRMLQEGATVLANGGMWCYWTYPMPDGAMIPSRARMAKKASEFANARRETAVGTDCFKWTAILDETRGGYDMNDSIKGAGKALIALHRSPEIIDADAFGDDAPYSLIVVPDQPIVTGEVMAKLESFVMRGGILLSTGTSAYSDRFQRLLGVRIVKRKALVDGHVFLSGGDPAGVYADWDGLEQVGAKEHYRLYRSFDDENAGTWDLPINYPITGLVDELNPVYSGYPAATVNRFGKGFAAHIPTDVFGRYWMLGDPQMLRFLNEFVQKLDPDPVFTTDAHSFVEVCLRKKDGDTLVHFINGNPGRDISSLSDDDVWVDDIPPAGPYRFALKTDRRPKSVKLTPGDAPLDFEWDSGKLTCEVPKFEIHCCAVIHYL
ncbi:MAG: hypothetical protein FWF03_07775 [Defluviitaleaceae bacterium]|nr:hypothetical protein [Defluviitaleaceae bacterium]